MLTTVLIVILVLLLIGALPNWGWHGYGPYPSGILGIVLIILVIWLVLGGRI